jgi:30S ribosomal protein S31
VCAGHGTQYPAQAVCAGQSKFALTPARILSIVARAFHQLHRERDIMGKGDKKTRRGKIFKGSYGKTRPHFPTKKPIVKRAGKKS